MLDPDNWVNPGNFAGSRLHPNSKAKTAIDTPEMLSFNAFHQLNDKVALLRAFIVQPNLLLMDEPCSALDPGSTFRIEQTIAELSRTMTIVIVTHNMQQAGRVSSYTGFFVTEVNPESDLRTGKLVEFNDTKKIFSKPDDERTEAYVTGKIG